MTPALREVLTRSPLGEDRGVLDFVGGSEEDYAGNFGDQWRRFREVQLDSASGQGESEARFFAETGLTPRDLAGKRILDAGCGAGRFAEVALRHGAKVVAADLSQAAYACAETLGKFGSEDHLVLRANLFDLPLAEGRFDIVYSIGVLQHTPDPLAGLSGLARFVAPGGLLAATIYPRVNSVAHWLRPKYLLRPVVSTWSLPAKLALAKALTFTWFPVGWTLSWFGRPGEVASRFLPYAARHHLGRGDLGRQWSYSVLDTYDWYGPVYDNPQTEQDVVKTMVAAGLSEVRRLPTAALAVVARRPQSSFSPPP